MFIFGIDIGGTSIKIGLFYEDGTLKEQWEIPTYKETIFQDLAKNLLNYLNVNQIKKEDILGYGIGIPGIMKNGIALSCVNLGWTNVDIKKEFCKAMGDNVKVFVFNDANIAAFGEAYFTDNPFDSVVFVTLGTGVGGGIIIQNEIVEGSNGLGGEIGHMKVDDTYQFDCSCGRKGCLETLASATGIVRLTKFHHKKYPTILNISETLTAKEVIDAAKKGDVLSSYVLQESCKALAKGLSNLSVTMNPDLFIIGGGLSNAGEFLLQEIQKQFNQVCISLTRNTKIQLAKLKNNAGIYGACAYLIKKKHEVEKYGKC
ncbi:MAG: ROK family glucokinase [Anaeroplasmataceae bacterium]|nr:ROK family glucokinase [Anaeroplasmataceae bacterium]